MRKMLSVSDAARHLGVTPHRVRVLISEGRLRAVKVGPNYVLTQTQVDAMVRFAPGRPKKNSEIISI